MRAEIARFLNNERTNRGLSLLPIAQDLQNQAQTWSEHNRSVQCEPSVNCHSPDAEAEILAWGGPDSRSGAIVEAWMRSTTHRDILLHPSATALGVGFACTEDGAVYATVQFWGVRKPVPATEEDPKVTRIGQGTACALPPSSAEASAPPPTTRAAPPSTSPSTTNAPVTTTTRRSPPPVIVTRQQAPPSTTAAPIEAALPVVTTTTAPSEILVGLRSNSPRITAGDFPVEALAFEESTARPATTEPAWVAMIVVVVLLYSLRIGTQVREAALRRRFENGGPGAGL
jgi:uncharacterized protein YkwD